MRDRSVSLDVVDGVAGATLKVDAPALLTGSILAELVTVLDEVEADPTVAVLVLRSSAAGFFACHFDVQEILAFDKRDESPTALKPYHALCERIRTMSTVSIAVIEGRVGGGAAEIAFSCDMRFARAEDAVFLQPEVALGLIPGGSGTVRIPRLVGRGRALEMILGCDEIDARTAEVWGLVNRALPERDLVPFVDRLARRIASFPVPAVRAAKAAVIGAELGVVEHLLDEAELFRQVLKEPGSRARMELFLAEGGQSLENESALGEFLGGLGGSGGR